VSREVGYIKWVFVSAIQAVGAAFQPQSMVGPDRLLIAAGKPLPPGLYDEKGYARKNSEG
jgi:hypothetical protein